MGSSELTGRNTLAMLPSGLEIALVDHSSEARHSAIAAEEKKMLRYIPGLAGAVAALVAFHLLGVLDFTIRILIFFVVYLVVTIAIDRAMSRYGKDK